MPPRYRRSAPPALLVKGKVFRGVVKSELPDDFIPEGNEGNLAAVSLSNKRPSMPLVSGPTQTTMGLVDPSGPPTTTSSLPLTNGHPFS